MQLLKMIVFWVVAPRSLVEVYRRFYFYRIGLVTVKCISHSQGRATLSTRKGLSKALPDLFLPTRYQGSLMSNLILFVCCTPDNLDVKKRCKRTKLIKEMQ
jgi:hypothetical protein